MHRIINPPCVEGADGEPAFQTELDCPTDCAGLEQCTGTDHVHCVLTKERGCLQPRHLKRTAHSLAKWVNFLLVALGNSGARSKLTLQDSAHVYRVIRACNVAGRKAREIRLEDADFEWLTKKLFNDEEGKRLAAGQKREGDAEAPVGAYAVQAVGPYMAAALERALNGKRDEDEDEEGGDL